MESLDLRIIREISLLLAISEDRALNNGELQKLEELLQECRAGCRFLAQVAWQRQEISMLESKQNAEEDTIEVGHQILALAAMTQNDWLESRALTQRDRNKQQLTGNSSVSTTDRSTRMGFFGGLLAGALAAGIALLAWVQRDAGRDVQVAHAPPEVFVTATTACVWGGNSDAGFRAGDSISNRREINLLEGIAEVRVNATSALAPEARFQIEGPSLVLFRTGGVPDLKYGKMIVNNTHSTSKLTIETRIGEVTVAEGATLGITTYLNKASLHVFRGSVTFADPSYADGSINIHEFAAGQSGFVLITPQGIKITTGEADPDLFAASRSIGLETLGSPERYVESVISSEPIAYWRFEEQENDVIRNEMSDKFSCHTSGPVQLTGPSTNRSIAIAWEDTETTLFTNESYDDVISDQYSIECWMKPSHYHFGTIVAMVRKDEAGSPEQQEAIKFAMTLDLYSMDITSSTIAQPGRVRFHQRNPPDRSWEGGTISSSNSPYTLRRWQHVVATKDGEKMKLYVNGRLAGVADESRPLPKGLSLFIGRRERTGLGVRRFIGQLDEIAIYNRALDQAEIKRHFESIQVVSSNPEVI